MTLTFLLCLCCEVDSHLFVCLCQHGEHYTDLVALFEQSNSIVVDLSASEFSLDRVTFDRPIVGLSSVSALRMHLVASRAQVRGVAIVDSLKVCAKRADTVDNFFDDFLVHTDDDEPQHEQPQQQQQQATFGDVESLSAALVDALGEIERLASEVASLRAAQRRTQVAQLL